ncbi:Hypothetical protein SCLAV_0810 [Streptomyces clavuligerus]|uniref:Uncharacterized protein n=1 Tax=Streptomyces clavuligerus TaxID=1901 RepID=E2PW54_STRCL|nr:Hypothetical protein SCLAV_0810 [Streptomyces clavuligerus]
MTADLSGAAPAVAGSPRPGRAGTARYGAPLRKDPRPCPPRARRSEEARPGRGGRLLTPCDAVANGRCPAGRTADSARGTAPPNRAAPATRRRRYGVCAPPP